MSLPPDYDIRTPDLPAFVRQPESGPVLCFSPHPDDEVMGPGGTLALHRQQGDRVRVVVATDGRAGDPDGRFAGADYCALRQQESRAGMAAVGVDDLRFWGLPDSCEIDAADLEGLVMRVTDELAELSPQSVYLPWSGEVHSDHRALFAAVRAGLKRWGGACSAWAYEVWTPLPADLLVDITPVAERKRAAIAAHRSQIEYIDYSHPILGLNAHRALLHNQGRGYCEAFAHVAIG